MWPFPPKVEEAHYSAIVGQVFVPNGAPVDISSSIRPQGWQADAWRLWRMVGELHSPTTYIARVVSRRLKYTVEENGTQLEEQAAINALTTALGDADLEETIRLMALNIQVAGEFWLIQRVGGWDVVPVTHKDLGDLVEKTRSAGRIAQRVYDPDPSDTDQADSSVRTAIDPAEDLVTLSALERAQSRSRIAQSGMLLVPAEAQFNGDPFGAVLEETMVTSIKDVSHPSAMVPLKVEMASELIDKVKHINFDRPFDDSVSEKVEKATKRIALALDIPPEILTGLGQMNHWNAWVAQDETYNTVVAPLAEKIAGVLEFIVQSVNGRVVNVNPDPADLLRTRPETGDVIEAAKMGAVGLEFVRKSIGADDNDIPSDNDIATIERLNGSRGGTTTQPTATEE